MDTPGRAAVQLLLDEASGLFRDNRYHDALRAAQAALRAAHDLGDDTMALKATVAEAGAYRMLGDNAGALANYTRVIATRNDPTSTADSELDWYVASAYFNWASSAGFLTEIAAADILAVLDDADAWLTATGHTNWRAATSHLRSQVLKDMGRTQDALGHAEEALAIKLAHPGAGPGFTLATYRCTVADLLRQLDRTDDARRHYQHILDDPATDSYGRKVAEQGLSRCATSAGDHAAAVGHARRAVDLAEPMGDNLLNVALEALTDAQLAAGAIAGAAETAARRLDIARALKIEEVLYFALRAAVDVALAQDHLDIAQTHLDEARPLAETIDRSRAIHTKADELTRRQKQLTNRRDNNTTVEPPGEPNK